MKDYTNKRFGKLICTEPTDKRSDGHIIWKVFCDCGNVEERLPRRLSENSECKACKSKRISKRNYKHGKSKSTEYKIWMDIKKRVKTGAYAERCITMSEDLHNNFEIFLEEVGERPNENYSVDRINTLKGYESGNIKWSTDSEQARNKRKYKNNKTGVTGVQNLEDRYVSTWYEGGRLTTKTFSKDKYGDKRAFELAIESRTKAIKRLNKCGAGYSKYHGK